MHDICCLFWILTCHWPSKSCSDTAMGQMWPGGHSVLRFPLNRFILPALHHSICKENLSQPTTLLAFIHLPGIIWLPDCFLRVVGSFLWLCTGCSKKNNCSLLSLSVFCHLWLSCVEHWVATLSQSCLCVLQHFLRYKNQTWLQTYHTALSLMNCLTHLSVFKHFFTVSVCGCESVCSLAAVRAFSFLHMS